MFAISRNFPDIKEVWLRTWIVLSLLWCVAAAWHTLPIQISAPSLDEVEAISSPTVVDLRKSCTRRTYSVEVVMGDGAHTLCFRSEGQADVYFKWLSVASENLHTEAKLKQRRITAMIIFVGPILLALIALILDWILRGAGKQFLFWDHRSNTNAPIHSDFVVSWLTFLVFACLVVFLPTGVALLLSKSDTGVEWTNAYVLVATIALIWVFVVPKKRSRFLVENRVSLKDFAKIYFVALAATAMWSIIVAAGVIGSMIGKRAFQ